MDSPARVAVAMVGVLVIAVGMVATPASGKCLDRGPIQFCADTDGISVDVQRATPRIDFGDVPVEDRRTLRLTVENEGRQAVSVDRVGISGADARAFSTDAGAFSLSPGQSRTVALSFAPFESGAAAATLRVERGRRTVTIDLRGNGTVPPPTLTVEPQSVRFVDAPVGQTTTRTVRLTNGGGRPLEISDASFAESGPFALRGATQVRIAPGESHDLEIVYDRERAEPASTTLHVTSNDPRAPTTSVFVTSRPFNATVERSDGRTRRTVETGQMVAGDALPMRLPDDGVDRAFELERMTVTPATSGQLSMSLTTSETALESSPPFERGDGTTPVGWLSIDHSMPNAQIESVAYAFRVERETLTAMGSSAEDVSFFRFEGDQWVAQDTTVVRETEGYVVLRAVANGMSEWTAAARRPRLNVTDSSVTLRTITTGESVTIQVFVENSGGTDGVYEAELLLNGETVDRRERTVPDGGTVVVSFERTFDRPGRYGVQVNDLFVGEVNVSTDSAVGTDGTPGSDESAGGADPFPLGPMGVGLVLLAGVGLWLYLRPERP